MNQEIAEYIKTCEICQSIKPPNQYNYPELQPILTSHPLELITTDIMGPCQETENKNKYILIIIDHFTKWMELYAMKTMEAVETAEKITAFTCRHGVPNRVLSDQGRNYQADLLSELYELLDIERSRTAYYNPRCDGLSERGNRTNKASLSALVNENDWDKLLQYVQFAYNTSVNASTKCTPFEMMYGRKPKLPLDLLLPELEMDLELDPENYAANLKKTLQMAYKLAKENSDCRLLKEKLYYDRKSRAAKYEIGDLVLLLDESTKKNVNNKFKKRWKGPYKVLEVDETGKIVKIKPSNRNGKSIRVNISKLKTYYKRISPKIAEIQPELITIKDEPEDYVENLEENNRIDKSKEKTKRKYIKKNDDINISGKQLSKKGKAKSIEKRKSTAIINSKFKGKKKKNTSALVKKGYTGIKGRLRSGNLKDPPESKNLLNINTKDPPRY